jgi:CRISPR-associated protein Cmr6
MNTYTYRKKLHTVYQQLRKPEEDRFKQVHPSLWLDKALEGQENKNSQLVKEVATIAVPEIYPHVYAAWKRQLLQAEIQVQCIQATSRIIIGLGNESVLETGISLQHTYGVPYLPGSALKGLAASYAHQQLKHDWLKGGELQRIIFGDTNNAGFITFLDAWYIPPEKPEPMLYQDVMTVHHPMYYRNEPGAAPTDSDSPTPIPFLSTGGRYLLALAAPDLKEKDPWLNATWRILEQALQRVGIGAKTSSGYGRMKFLRTPEEEALRQKELEQQKALRQKELEQQKALRQKELEQQKVLQQEVEERQKAQIFADTLASLPPESRNEKRSEYYNYWRALQLQSSKLLLGHAILRYIQAGNPKKGKRPEDDKDYQEVRIYVEKQSK